MTDKQSRRALFREYEFRFADDGTGDGHTLEGYAAVFDEDSRISSWEGNFTERIAKGAFRKTLAEKTPIMQYDHGRDVRVGSVPIGVYEELREDHHGLYVRGRVFDNDVVEPVRQAIEGGAITGMSFKFRVIQDEWRDANGRLLQPRQVERQIRSGQLRRVVKEVALAEAGPVASPAYQGTSVGVRNEHSRTRTDRDRQLRLHELERGKRS